MKKGITIVTLVITVIVLAVLTGAVMLTMVGDNGIFGETQSTIDKYNKQAMLEQIKLKIQKKRLAKVNEGQYTLNLSEDILPILETFGTYNENEMKLTTTEKNIDIYLYEIINIPIKEIANVTYVNEELTISEKVQLPNGYTFEYTKDNGITWSEYTSTTTIAEENGILIRLKNEEGKVVSSEYKVTSGVIEEIDSTKPIISIDTNGVTTGKTIKVTIIVTDEKGLDRNNTYEYCISTSNNDTTGATWIPYTNGISFTVGEGLTGGYYIHVKGVTDTSGNESENKVSEMLTFDNTVPAVTIDIGRITDTSIEVLAQSTDNSGQVKSTEYSIDNGAHWYTNNTFTNLTANTSYTVQVKSVDIFNNENTVEKAVTTNLRTWNGKIDISWYTKNPNKTTFDISTPNELAGLALLVDNEIVYYDDPHDANNTSGTYSIAGSEFEGKTIVLNNDILMNENVLNEDGTLNEANASSFVQWEPIGESHMGITSGISVEDLDSSDLWEMDESEYRKFKGIFDGKKYDILGMYINKEIVWDQALFGTSFGTIQNVNIVDSYVSARGQHIAGIVGYCEGNIYGCTNEGSIFGGDYWHHVAGIVGRGKNVNIYNSCNKGLISGQAVSGICNSLSGYNEIINCVNEGFLFSKAGCGGVVGNIVNGLLINCYNSGVLSTGYNNYKYSGGIVRQVKGNLGILNCCNVGNYIGENSETKEEFCGGIVGLGYKDSELTFNIQNCYNLGNLSSITGAGGILSNMYLINYANISNCFNYGIISSESSAGGIVATGNGTNMILNNVYNKDTSYFGSITPQPIGTYGTITGAGANASITVNGQTKTVIQALNEWVTANKATYPELKYWGWDNVNSRPMFVDSI